MRTVNLPQERNEVLKTVIKIKKDIGDQQIDEIYHSIFERSARFLIEEHLKRHNHGKEP